MALTPPPGPGATSGGKALSDGGSEDDGAGDLGSKIFANLRELFFDPEIKKRREDGSLPPEVGVWAVQAIMPESGGTTIRLNEEIKGLAIIKSSRVAAVGDSVAFHELDGLEGFELATTELDCGHVTGLQMASGRWFLAFNFLRGRARAKDIVDRAEQFLETAEFCIGRGLSGPAVDNLFSAAELLAKAYLIMHMSPAATRRTHSSIASALNAEGRLRNVPADFVRLFNQLSNLRDSARYSAGSEVTVPDGAAQLITRTVEWLRTHWAPLLPPTSEDDGEASEDDPPVS